MRSAAIWRSSSIRAWRRTSLAERWKRQLPHPKLKLLRQQKRLRRKRQRKLSVPPFHKRSERMGHPACAFGRGFGLELSIPPFRQKRRKDGASSSQIELAITSLEARVSDEIALSVVRGAIPRGSGMRRVERSGTLETSETGTKSTTNNE